MVYCIKSLGIADYQPIWKMMQDFTEKRKQNTFDEFWVLQHNPVFTLGVAGNEAHILNKAHSIPVIRVDRGGQVTYHGLGQIIIYTLIDIKRLNVSVRDLVIRLENGIINYLCAMGINANSDRCAPGVYVAGKKIASIGLKIRKNCTYHGISFNANMDTTPFNYINVCGYSGLEVAQLKDLTKFEDIRLESIKLVHHIVNSVYTVGN
ncbi:MAG: lipoyl(octanoyl) transferase LipB [Burkholderiales bacterium]|nr:lipoyl(octanoyl) transferase LipB [Burkholderiales bacterium]